ncbi:MAG: hypothetical protein ACM31C_22795 [Acidobacteriota bacterium]
MNAYIFFSVHEELFHRVALRLRSRGVDRFCGFVWGTSQADVLRDRGIDYDPLVVFTRDLLPSCDDDTRPDLEWLEQRERELGVSITRMLASERHLLAGRSYEQIQRMAEVALREIAAAYDRARPDFVFSEDVSCFHSYVHFVLARERGIPFWCIGTGRLPNRLGIYSSGFQRLERVEQMYRELVARPLTDDERAEGERYITSFRERPVRPPGMDVRARMPGLERSDVRRFRETVRRFVGDPKDPVAVSPVRAVKQRVQRISRVALAAAARVFDEPRPGEKYVVYPIHFQPEASTLVQAPLYLDQVALLQDIARSLPIGHRLYVKEHVSNRGRRPLAFYEAIRDIPAVRLLSPDTDTWALIRDASAIAVITGTMGWEGLLFDKPVVTFGDVFFNVLPHVYRASEVPKDGWYQLFRRAIFEHRPDRDALLAYIVALHRASHPGVIHNPGTFPHVLQDDNVAHITDALAATIPLPG